jgi:hypothetical protein
MKNGEDMRDHIRNFFDVVNNLEEMELCIINEYEYEYEARKRNLKENVSDAIFINKIPDRSNQPNQSENSKSERFKFACHTCGKIGGMAKD